MKGHREISVSTATDDKFNNKKKKSMYERESNQFTMFHLCHCDIKRFSHIVPS